LKVLKSGWSGRRRDVGVGESERADGKGGTEVGDFVIKEVKEG
jgi:hypothetical protein